MRTLRFRGSAAAQGPTAGRRRKTGPPSVSFYGPTLVLPQAQWRGLCWEQGRELVGASMVVDQEKTEARWRRGFCDQGFALPLSAGVGVPVGLVSPEQCEWTLMASFFKGKKPWACPRVAQRVSTAANSCYMGCPSSP